jgi:cobalt-zinc-cadmium efflux system outer membrane protein
MQIPVAGQRQKAFELALKNLELTKNNLAEFQRNILFLVANKWGDAWISSQRLGILKKAKQYSDDLLTTNELRYKKEAITLAEFNRTQIIAEQYNALLDLEEQVFKNELRLLKALTGSEEQMIIKEEDSSGTELLEIDIDLMISDALKNRSDILSGKIAEELSRKDLILQEAKAYPRPEIGFIYNPQNTDPYMGTFLTIPLPVFNRNQGEILRAKSELEQKAKKLNAIEIQIDTEVRNAFAEYSVAKRNYEKYKNIYKISEKVLDTVKYSYLRGGTTIVDYLEAQRNWFETQNLYYNSIFNLRRTFILLIFSNGRILEY